MANPQPDQFTKMSNELLSAMCFLQLSGSSWQVIMVVLRFTYGYQRKTVVMTNPQLVERTGLSARTAEKARSQLIKDGIITTERNGYRGSLEYSINKNYEKWPCFKSFPQGIVEKPVNKL